MICNPVKAKSLKFRQAHVIFVRKIRSNVDISCKLQMQGKRLFG